MSHPHILLQRTLLLNAMEISNGTPVKVKRRSLTTYLRTLRGLPKSSQNMIENLLSHSEVLESSNSNNEKYRTVIEQIVTNVYTNLTISELEEMTSLSTENTRIVSMAMPIYGLELKCENMLLAKTTITPILNPKARKEVMLKWYRGICMI